MALTNEWLSHNQTKLKHNLVNKFSPASSTVAEDVRMESDGGAFLVGPCNSEDPENGNEEYDDYNVENDGGDYCAQS